MQSLFAVQLEKYASFYLMPTMTVAGYFTKKSSAKESPHKQNIKLLTLYKEKKKKTILFMNGIYSHVAKIDLQSFKGEVQ